MFLPLSDDFQFLSFSKYHVIVLARKHEISSFLYYFPPPLHITEKLSSLCCIIYFFVVFCIVCNKIDGRVTAQSFHPTSSLLCFCLFSSFGLAR
jgi:hypothetical protein